MISVKDVKEKIQNSGNIVHLPPDITLDFNKGFGEYLFEALGKYNEEIAQIDAETGQQESYKDFFDRSISLAQALRAKGIKPKDVVVYCCANNMDYVVVILASGFIGATFSAFDNMANSKGIAHYINLISPKIIFCDQSVKNVIKSAFKQTGQSCDIIEFKKMPEFIQKYKTKEKFEIDKSIKIKDTSCILFTSGTSGLEKGAEITGYGLYYGAINAKRILTDISTSMVFTLPSWISNISFTLLALIIGCTRVIYKAFNKDNLIRTLQEYKANITMLTQNMMNILMKYPENLNYDMSNVKYILFGGSIIAGNTLSEILKLFPNATLINCFGLTEVGGLLFGCPTEKHYFDSAGRITCGLPNPGFYYKIVDTETEECLGPNMHGELRFKYEGIMNCYINNIEQTDEAFDKEGFFKTGDLVYYDENYLFYVVDRLKEVFKYNGRQISPTVIEDQLLQHSAVRDVAVIPIPDPDDNGEIPLACILLRQGVTAKEEDFVQFVSENLNQTYQLRGGVKFVESIPRTSTGKLLKDVLKEQIFK